MSHFNPKQTIGEIVSMMPKAGEVFKQYQIDFCCGGNRTLAEAIKEQSLNEAEILKKLDEVFEETQKLKNQVDYRKMSSVELIDYIVNKHHSYLWKVLPELSEYTTKILRVHGANHGDLFKVHKLFHALRTELEHHLIKEEELIFPMIREYEKNPSKDLAEKIKNAVVESESEHDSAGDVLKELRQITNQYAVPEDGCATYCVTFDKLQELESDLFEHIHLENNILFKRFGG